MPWFDLPEPDLRTYRTRTAEPADLDQWWRTKLEEARAVARPPVLAPYEPEVYGDVAVDDVEFSGAANDPIRGWFVRPSLPSGGAPPLVVTYAGYGGGRGRPIEHLTLASVGIAQFVMDTRGQGGVWTTGSTGDRSHGNGPEHPGVMTRGIASPDSYYYTRLIVDAARAVEVGAALEGVDPDWVAVSGKSQGGGLALAAAALHPDLVRVCHVDVPSLCDFQRAVGLSPTRPYKEIADFLAQHVDLVPAALDTLRYVDCALLARRITAECLFSVGLMDETCPPSTVFAAYNEVTSTKAIAVHPFTGHTVPPAHAERRLRHLRERLVPRRS